MGTLSHCIMATNNWHLFLTMSNSSLIADGPEHSVPQDLIKAIVPDVSEGAALLTQAGSSTYILKDILCHWFYELNSRNIIYFNTGQRQF